MAALFALITSVVYGTSDFLGGLATGRGPLLRIMAWVHGAGLVAVLILAPILAERIVAVDLLWGLLSGAVGLIGMVALYWALAIGPMGAVAPLSGIMSAAVPLVFGLIFGTASLSPTVALGIAFGLAAVVASSWPTGGAASMQAGPAVIGGALFAGTCFGALVLFYDQTLDDGAPWPIVAGRLLTTTVLVVAVLARRSSNPPMPRSAIAPALAAGVGDAVANVTLLLAALAASTGSELSVVGVLVGFYPAFTVLCARIVLGEPLGRVRSAGLVLALGAIALMTLS